MGFQRATLTQAKLRMGLMGPSGSGKTYTSLALGCALGAKVAVIDSERGSASKYAKLFTFDVDGLGDDFGPQRYVDKIHEAERAGYDVLIIDSLSHAWMGKGGALELVDTAARKSQSNNTYTAWRNVTPLHNALVDAILQSKLHIIATMRTKTEYVMERDERTGKTVPKRVGLAPVQRQDMEYEFDVVGEMDLENSLIISKSRCPTISGAVVQKPGAAFAQTLKDWLSDGEPVPVAAPVAKLVSVKDHPIAGPADDNAPQEAREPEATTPVTTTEPINAVSQAIIDWKAAVDSCATREEVARQIGDMNKTHARNSGVDKVVRAYANARFPSASARTNG